MADIYGFGPGWDLPATVQDNVKTLVDQHLAGNPSGDALVAGIVNVGERDITALAPGVTDGKIYISRYGPLVTLQFDGLVVPPDQTSYKMFTNIIGPGFRPNRNVDFRTTPRTTTEHLDTAVVYTSGNVVIYKYASEQAIRGVWTWRTTQAAPSVLPGVAV